jgi:hypothetical protein
MSWPFPPPLPPTPAIALDVAELVGAVSEALVDVEEAEVTVVVMLAGDCSFKQEESPEPWTVMISVLQARVGWVNTFRPQKAAIDSFSPSAGTSRASVTHGKQYSRATCDADALPSPG